MRQVLATAVGFPVNGKNVVSKRTAQADGSCVNCMNVTLFDQLEDRLRGGTRPGLTHLVNTQINGSNAIQALEYVAMIKAEDPATANLNRREIRTVAVAGGTVKGYFGGAVNAATVNGTATLNATVPFMSTTKLFGRVYISDGYDYKVWVASNNTTIDWTPTAGSLPGDPGNTSCRLMCTWRTRIVLSGLASDPHNWFMTAASDPLDLDYSPNTISETQAVAGSIGTAGKLEDVVNCLIPLSDDLLAMGGDKSIWRMTGDPQAGGRFDLITDSVGMAFGTPYCQDPIGKVYFMSSRNQVYRMEACGSIPEPLSHEAIDPALAGINLNTNLVTMSWDTEQEGFWMFVTPFANAATTHYFWSAHSQGWFPIKFAATELNPMTVSVFDGDTQGDRTVIIGSDNGYINMINSSVATDIGANFTSHITIGPLKSPEGSHRIIVREVQTLSDPDGSALLLEVMVGDSPQEAHGNEKSSFVGTHGTLGAGMSGTVNPHLGGYYSYLKLGNIISSRGRIKDSD
jgi:hypothetical protein